MGQIADKVKGKIKRAAGVLVGNKKLERRGKGDEARGQVKRTAEDLKHDVKRGTRR